jgi:hypothetical protein
MHVRILNMVYDFMQVVSSIKKHITNIEYFPKPILFTTIYLMQEQKLNPNKYYEKDIIIKKNYKLLNSLCTCMQIFEILLFMHFCN